MSAGDDTAPPAADNFDLPPGVKRCWAAMAGLPSDEPGLVARCGRISGHAGRCKPLPPRAAAGPRAAGAGDDTTPPAEVPLDEHGCVPLSYFPTLRDGQARVRLGESGVEIVPDRAAAGPRAGDTAPDDDDYNATFSRDEVGASEGVESYDTSGDRLATAYDELDRLRSDAAALRDERDHFARRLDAVQDGGSAHVRCREAIRQRDENNAALRDAGNELADAAAAERDPNDAVGRGGRLPRAVVAWRSAAGGER